jgi:RNA polymerase sigma-70 factor (ECF subfamily)
MTIAMNLVRDQWRSRQRKPVVSLEFEPMDMQSSESLPERVFEMRDLHRVLGALAPLQREVIELHWLQERPFAEVAQVMGISEGAARVRAHRAYGQLKALLLKQRTLPSPTEPSDS